MENFIWCHLIIDDVASYSSINIRLARRWFLSNLFPLIIHYWRSFPTYKSRGLLFLYHIEMPSNTAKCRRKLRELTLSYWEPVIASSLLPTVVFKLSFSQWMYINTEDGIGLSKGQPTKKVEQSYRRAIFVSIAISFYRNQALSHHREWFYIMISKAASGMIFIWWYI